MKKAPLFILSVALTLFVNSCKKEELEQKINNVSSTYKPLVIKFAATWCYACGSQGYPHFQEIMNQHGSTITVLNINADDAINSGTPPGSSELRTFYNVPYVPYCAVNTSAGFSPWPIQINDTIEFARAQHPKAKAGIGFSMKIEGNNAVITTKTVAFEALTGRYSLAVYLTEDNIVQEQNGLLDGPGHFDHIFRAAESGQPWGDPIITSSCEAGAVFDKTHTIAISADVRDRNNLHPVVVLYKINPATSLPVDVINSNHN
ncbi:MAG: Omp28-related outer membrane protein [Bacteroidetes bacterium]|nr:Omp28-related outer membrane protein [Bacteroidota bacterium]